MEHECNLTDELKDEGKKQILEEKIPAIFEIMDLNKTILDSDKTICEKAQYVNEETGIKLSCNEMKYMMELQQEQNHHVETELYLK